MRVFDRMAGLAGLTGGGRNDFRSFGTEWTEFYRGCPQRSEDAKGRSWEGESSNREIGERIERSEA